MRNQIEEGACVRAVGRSAAVQEADIILSTLVVLDALGFVVMMLSMTDLMKILPKGRKSLPGSGNVTRTQSLPDRIHIVLQIRLRSLLQ